MYYVRFLSEQYGEYRHFAGAILLSDYRVLISYIRHLQWRNWTPLLELVYSYSDLGVSIG